MVRSLGLDAHHGATAQLSGGLWWIGQHTEKFSSRLPEYQKLTEERMPAVVRKTCKEMLVGDPAVCKTFQSVTTDPSRLANPQSTIYLDQKYLCGEQ